MSEEAVRSHTNCTWPDDPDCFVTSAQVADYLGYPDVRAFHRAKPWRDAHGFPPQPLPRRWRARQILDWEARRKAGTPQPPPPANDMAPAPSASTAREKLAALQERRRGSSHG